MSEIEVMPFDMENNYVQVFFQHGDLPFICGVIGKMCLEKFNELEHQISQDYQDNETDIFNENGMGDYLLKITYDDGEFDGEAHAYIHKPHWEYELIKFEPHEFIYQEQSHDH